MSKPLSPSLRRQIIAYDPSDPAAPSISAFCRSLGISRPSFYTVRDRYRAEGNAALNPRSRAPKQPARRFDEHTARAVLGVRQRLTADGWDAGPKSIWWVCVDEEIFDEGSQPSVSTIARILAEAGVVVKNPRKRPRSSYLRFQRGAAMELWQLDAFEFRLFDHDLEAEGTKITIYQLVDDSTRFDVGTTACALPENGEDAVTVVTVAMDTFGVPQQLLSDNGSAFNLARRGSVARLQFTLADRGCLGITGQFSSPTTQGKNERSHQTLQRVLKARKPATLEQAQEMVHDYRMYYNDRRHHQSLPANMTPSQAWQASEHRPSDATPIAHADLIARAKTYKDRAIAATAQPGDGLLDADHQRFATGNPSLVPDEIVIKAQNPHLSFYGKIIAVPVSLVGKYKTLVTDTEYRLFDVTDGAETLAFALPLDTTPFKTRYCALWQVRGARMRNPKPSWLSKQREFATLHYQGPTTADTSTKS